MKKLIKDNKYIFVLLGVFFVLGIFSVRKTIFNSVKKVWEGVTTYHEAVPSIQLDSSTYDNEGSWSIEKKAKWLSKDTIEISIDINSILLGKDTDKDIIFVLDTSNSMQGEKISRLKSDTESLIEYLAWHNNNRMAMITFNSTATLHTNFTQNKENLYYIINNLVPIGRTNYYDAFVKVDSVLSNYTYNPNRDLIVLFLTDGYPDLGNPNQVTMYNLLKEKYPFITINGVQYEMGEKALEPIVEITDKQWIAKMTSLSNVLYAASEATELYHTFNVKDVINTDYFYIEDISDITTSYGNVSLVDNTITWDLGTDTYTTGSNSTLKIKAHLKDEFIDHEGYYPTNDSLEANSELLGNKENRKTTSTPVLKNRFKVTYDSNMPEGCQNIAYPEENYYVFDNVAKKTEILSCEGYLFGGWKIVEDGINYINSDNFIMPQFDVTIRAEWKKGSIEKTMEGEVHSKITLYKKIENDYDNSATDIEKYTGPGATNYENNVYYYFGETENNNVLFGNYCWKIVRTTDTGGVKLLYNGVMTAENGCNTTANTITSIGYNPAANSPGYVGYMFPKTKTEQYAYQQKKLSDEYYFIAKEFTEADADYYYSDSMIWDGSQYVLQEPEHGTWRDMYQNSSHKYVCRNGSTSCTDVYYIVFHEPVDLNSTGSNQYLYHLTNGELLADVNKTMYFATGVENGSLTGVVEVTMDDWVNNHSNYVGYYTCADPYTSECSNTYYVRSTGIYYFTYFDMSHNYQYGNSFTWDGNKYTLTNTKAFWNWNEGFNTLNNNHYTCFNNSGECEELYYIIITTKTNNDYDALAVPLVGGKSISDALDEMLNNNDINQNNSNVKAQIDRWYQNNMEANGFTDYLEDTVYCNKREIADLGNWSPNNSNTSWGMYYYTYTNRLTADLTCNRKVDQFTVSSENGNGNLTYPVGLLTQSEAALANHGNETNSYIKSASTYWTMSPSTFYTSNQSELAIAPNGTFNPNALLWYGFGARPVVSLRPEIEYSGGDGSYMHPYIVG